MIWEWRLAKNCCWAGRAHLYSKKNAEALELESRLVGCLGNIVIEEESCKAGGEEAEEKKPTGLIR